MQLAIQEAMLPGVTTHERLVQARELGFAGVEFAISDDFAMRLPEVVSALDAMGMRASAVNIGHTRLIHPDEVAREVAVVAMRQAMTYAVDLGAQGVVFKGFYAPGAVLPDLHPYKSALELEAELLIMQLRATLTDLAYALGTELLLEPVNHTESHLVRRVAHAALVRHKLDGHPHLKIAANVYQMQLEQDPWAEALQQHSADIGYIHLADLADGDRALPGQGVFDWDAILAALHAVGYQGWLALDCAIPGQPGVWTLDDLAHSVATLRRAAAANPA
ncbi:MAG: sugar phosphate isomerase/epimerase [Armatimonadetes bacterium]|nr:sugar phosphate isomerase/epimerase [Anaerolineae bacterium]